MKDKEFLIWIHERLEHVHDESPLYDYMHKLRQIISVIPPDQESNGFAGNDIGYIKNKITNSERWDFINQSHYFCIRDWDSLEAPYKVYLQHEGMSVNQAFQASGRTLKEAVDKAILRLRTL